MTERNHSIGILGAGSVGRLWAAYLQQQHHVLFISDRAQDEGTCRYAFEPYQASETASVPWEIAVAYARPDQAAPRIDLLLLCTKSYQASAAMVKLDPYLPKTTPVILFQNGLGSQHQLIENFNDRPLLAAVTTEGVNTVAGPLIIHAGKGQTSLGPLNKAGNEANLPEIEKTLTGTGLDVSLDPEIWQKLWLKLAINCAINPFTALENVPNGKVPQTGLFKSLWPELQQELSQMLKSAGYALSQRQLDEKVFEVIEKTGTNISSMLQDVRQGRPTEIDDINGFAASYLKSKGLSANCNQKLCEAVHALGH